MADKYDLTTVTDTHNRLSDPDLTEQQMRVELETVDWVPEDGRMIAISDSKNNLDGSKRFGFFLGFTEKGLYETDTGRAKYARPLTAEELTHCF